MLNRLNQMSGGKLAVLGIGAGFLYLFAICFALALTTTLNGG